MNCPKCSADVLYLVPVESEFMCIACRTNPEINPPRPAGKKTKRKALTRVDVLNMIERRIQDLILGSANKDKMEAYEECIELLRSHHSVYK